MSARTIAVGCLASATFIAGCAPDDATLALPEPSSPAATTTTHPRTFTEASTTTTSTSTTTTATPTASALTSTAPPTTLSTLDQIRADFLSDRMARQQCSYEPEHCDFARFAVPGSPADVTTRAKITERIADNLRALPGHGDVRVRIDAVTLAGSTATVTACTYDTVIIYDAPAPGVTGDGIVFDDGTTSLLVRWDMRLVDGRWLMFASTELKRLEGADLCGF